MVGQVWAHLFSVYEILALMIPVVISGVGGLVGSMAVSFVQLRRHKVSGGASRWSM